MSEEGYTACTSQRLRVSKRRACSLTHPTVRHVCLFEAVEVDGLVHVARVVDLAMEEHVSR